MGHRLLPWSPVQSSATNAKTARDGTKNRISIDFRLEGMKVTITCTDGDGQVTMSREETTNVFGTYVMGFDGTPDLSNCNAQVSGSGEGSNDCGAAPGPAQKLKIYPMSFCPRSSDPVPAPVVTPKPPSGPAPPTGSPPTFRLPSLPPLPPLPPMPPLPFSEASACSHQYGMDMSLRESLEGRGDPYKTLLREATTALLNSYNSSVPIQFSWCCYTYELGPYEFNPRRPYHCFTVHKG
ncbi:putative Glycine-rich protein [Hibiscus syriacus]|uniref:Glycine-rich protein n=1 Tax=Hibiscus syriacus TaxID=106335 RepID=A0A6A3C8V8_HIBSY|nr:putative Glycine-rich protein [Hibiscus syriacus]